MRTLIVTGIALAAIAPGGAQAGEFTLKSDDLGRQLAEAQVYAGFGCHGRNISPSLRWTNVPSGTKSFAVTAFDPDAPSGGWWHWLIFDIPPDVTELRADAGRIDRGLAPAGSVQSVTDFGTPGYGGACPPQGDKPHHYVFTVHALGVDRLGLDARTPPEAVGSAIRKNAIAQASITSLYQR